MVYVAMPRPIPTFRGDLVTLRPPDPAVDAVGYFEDDNEADARSRLERFLSPALAKSSTWLIIDNSSGRVVGRISGFVEDRDGTRVASGTNLVQASFRRKGHNREALKVLLRYFVEELGTELFEMLVEADNASSRKSLESQGFQLVREQMTWDPQLARMTNLCCYALTREQWLARERLDFGRCSDAGTVQG